MGSCVHVCALGEVVDMKLLPRSAFGVPLHLLFSHGQWPQLPLHTLMHLAYSASLSLTLSTGAESSSNGLAAASIDVVLREDGRVAAGRGLITDLMPTTTDEKHVRTCAPTGPLINALDH